MSIFSFSSGYLDFVMHPPFYPVGKSKVSFECESWDLIKRGLENMTLEIQLRNNTNDNWTSVAVCNASGVFREIENIYFDSFTILSVREKHQQMTLRGSVQSKQCAVDPKKFPDVRCVLIDESRIIDSSERSIFSIEGICSCFLYFVAHS